MSLAAGVEGKSFDKAITAYIDELTHFRYFPQARVSKAKDADLLKRVAELSSSAK